MTNFIHLLKITKRNIRRTPYQAIAASMVMFFTFLVVTAFVLLTTGFQKILVFYETKPQAIAFFKDGTSADDVNAIQNALYATSKIKEFKYVSKEQALEIYRERNQNNPLLLELVTANILPASLEISTNTPEDLKTIAEIVRKEPVVEEVVFPEDVVQSLSQATRMVRVIGGSLAGFLMVFSTLIVIMIIGFKIRIKRPEIEIMRLLGAPSWFIRMPFIFEGIFYGSVGAFFGWISTFGLFWYFEPLVQNQLGEVSAVLFPVSLLFIAGVLGVELVAAVLVGGLGSLVAVRRYLNI